MPPPREVEQYLRTFCGDADNPEALNETEALRIAFYKAVATLVRAFAAISQDLSEAGYADDEIETLNREIEFFADVRAAVKKHSGEELDIKPYEADMRHLINTYIQADPVDPLGSMDNYSLVELIIETGIHDAIAKKLNEKGKLSKNAVAEGIINNIRKTIIRDQLNDPKFYEEMSKLLDDLIAMKRSVTESYEEFLKKAESLVLRMAGKTVQGTHPTVLNGHPEAIRLYNNLPGIAAEGFQCPEDEDERAALALGLDQAMREQAPAGWKGDDIREKEVLNALFPLMNRNRQATLAVFEIIRKQSGYA